jgi:CubicO group peptidase (beta-lactamase class C family)
MPKRTAATVVCRAVHALTQIDGWPAPPAAVGVWTAQGLLATRGPLDVRRRIASISKLLTAYAVMVAVEEGSVSLDDPVDPPGATLRHLLAHAAGFGFESDAAVLAAPGTRRIYSNRGIEEAADHIARATGITFADYLAEAVLKPLQMSSTAMLGSPAFGVHSTVDDLGRFVAELFTPRLVAPSTLASMTTVQFAGLNGVLPGVGRFAPLDWGLAFERNFARPGHWAGTQLSPATFGHFGGSGTFLWLDPTIELACVMVAAREFDEWGMATWPSFCDDIVREATGRAS